MSLSAVRSLARRYVVSLGAVAVLALAGQAVIQAALSAQQQHGRVINLAGRQRMLSQKIAKDALAASTATRADVRRARLGAVRDGLELWAQVHRGLQDGDATLGLPGRNTAAVATRFAEMEPVAQRFAEAAERAATRPGDAAAIEALLTAQEAYLPLMDAVVFAYDAEARAAVRHVRYVEAGLFGLTLLVLFVEGAFVFRPTVARTREAMEALTAANDDLAASRRAAESAERAKAAILANMSHEVRTPLQGVLGYTELLRAEAGPAHDDLVAPIERGAHRLLRTLDSIIEVARLSGGEAADRPAGTCDLGGVAEGVAELFRADAEAKGLSLTLDAEPDVLAAADAASVSRALAAVVDNAIKFTEVGGVRISAHSARGHALVRVVDTGMGLDVGTVDGLGTAFRQASEGHARRHEGLGLGLTLAINLVRAMGGEVRVASEGGTRVTFVLPSAEAAPSPDREERPGELTPAVTFR